MAECPLRGHPTWKCFYRMIKIGGKFEYESIRICLVLYCLYHRVWRRREITWLALEIVLVVLTSDQPVTKLNDFNPFQLYIILASIKLFLYHNLWLIQNFIRSNPNTVFVTLEDSLKFGGSIYISRLQSEIWWHSGRQNTVMAVAQTHRCYLDNLVNPIQS